jgi:hypothetical protein
MFRGTAGEVAAMNKGEIEQGLAWWDSLSRDDKARWLLALVKN